MLVTICQIILNKNMFSHNCISGWHWVQKLQFLEMTVIKWSLCSGVHLGQGRTYLQNCLKTRTNPSVVVVVRVKRLRCVVQQMNTFMSQRRSQWASESRPFAYLLIWFFSAVVTFASLNTRCQLFVMKFLCNTHTHTVQARMRAASCFASYPASSFSVVSSKRCSDDTRALLPPLYNIKQVPQNSASSLRLHTAVKQVVGHSGHAKSSQDRHGE